MIVYHYDPDTGAFANTSSEADQDPLDPSRWLIPANATPIAPPHVGDPKKNHAVFRDEAWVVEPMPFESPLKGNLMRAPTGGMWPRLSIKEALKGGVT